MIFRLFLKGLYYSLFKGIEKWSYRANVLTVWDGFSLEFQARLGAGLSLEVIPKHFLALCAVVETNLYEIDSSHGIYYLKEELVTSIICRS